MISRRCVLLAAAIMLVSAPGYAQSPSDSRVADIVSAGKIRIGLHLPQFVQDPNSGAIHGHGTGTVIVPIAQALAEHLKVKLELVGNRAPPVLIKCLQEVAATPAS